MTDTRRKLYPEIEPYETGMLDVGECHSLYYERVGTPGAKPAVFLHGGPGGGMAPAGRCGLRIMKASGTAASVIHIIIQKSSI